MGAQHPRPRSQLLGRRVRPHRPGHTDNPAEPEDYTFAEVLRHAIAVVEAEAPSGAHVVGHSRGALVAARLAQERPDLVRTLVVCDTNTLAPPHPSTPVGFYAELERQIPDGYRTLEDVTLEPRAQSHADEHVTREFADGMLAIARTQHHLDARAVMAKIKLDRWYPDVDAARDEALDAIDGDGLSVPTLLVWGRDDPSAPPALGLDLFSRIAPRTTECGLQILERAGHYVFRERPEAFNALVTFSCRQQGYRL